jgi:2-methylcitrate dehydratase PrpD
VTENLGRVFEGPNSAFKPYPSCACTHASISAALDLVSRHNILPEEVDRVEVAVDTQSLNLVAEPRELKTKPRQVVDGQFSVPFTVARAILKRDVFVADFTEDTIRDKPTLALAEKVMVTRDARMDELTGYPAEVKIRTRRGDFFQRVDHVKGTPENPMSMDDIIGKFRKCIPFSARAISPQTTERIIETVVSLDQLQDTAELAELLALGEV